MLMSLVETKWHSDGSSGRDHGTIVWAVYNDGCFVSQLVETRIEHVQTSLDGAIHFAETVCHDQDGVLLFLIVQNISFYGI